MRFPLWVKMERVCEIPAAIPGNGTISDRASINNWDMSFMKNTFVCRQRVKLQLRCEFTRKPVPALTLGAMLGVARHVYSSVPILRLHLARTHSR